MMEEFSSLIFFRGGLSQIASIPVFSNIFLLLVDMSLLPPPLAYFLCDELTLFTLRYLFPLLHVH